MTSKKNSQFRQSVALWVLIGFASYLLFPWYFLQRGSLLSALPSLWSAAEVGSGLAQAWSFGRWWLWPGLGAFGLAGVALLAPSPKTQGWLLLVSSGIGFVGLGSAALLIGPSGWNYDWLNSRFGPLDQGQYGIGWGGFIAWTCVVMLFGAALARLGSFNGDFFVSAAVTGCGALLLLFVVLPVFKALSAAFYNEGGEFSLAAVTTRIATERVWGAGCITSGTSCGVAWNTLFLALLTAAGTTVLGTIIALLSERGASARVRRPLNALAMLPIITPPFVVGLGLILFFGRSGIVNQVLEYLFGISPTRWFYGVLGVWLAQLFAFTPIAYMIMRGVVQGISPSMEEASLTLRASRLKTFSKVTLPLLAPGLANAFLVGFIESIADFGNPILLGGNYAVLSTEVFFAIVGASLDQGMAAALALILTVFALAIFFIQRIALGKTSYTTVSGKGDAGIPMALPKAVLLACKWIAGCWLAFTGLIYIFAFVGGFVKTWGRDYTLTLSHFKTAFGVQWESAGLIWSGTAWNSLWTTFSLAGIAAPICALLGMLIAWLVARTEFRSKPYFEFSALLTFAIPGTVLGVSYILAFNVPPLELTGSGIIIILCFVFRNLPVGVRAGAASFRQLDKSLDEASVMLGASSLTTLRRITLPLLKPAMVAALVYSFVRSMTTVSAVIFLVTAEYELSTTFIIGRVGQGDYGVALAYCTVLIFLMTGVTGLIQFAVGERKLGRRQVS